MYTKINYIIKFGKILKLLFLGHQPHSTISREKKIDLYYICNAFTMYII